MPILSTSKKTRFSTTPSRRPPIERGRWAAKGTKPLPEQPSIQHVLSIVLVHACRKVLFIQTEVKITLYAIALFFGSLIFDFMPVPKIYLSNKDNVFNVYFVKLGWGWTLLVVGAFICLTSYTYGCGRREIVKRHLMRLVIGTVFWYFWTCWFFVTIEEMTGACLGKAILKNKKQCKDQNFQWHSFDISGHTFMLVYINLLLVEEAKAIVGWEGIKDLIRVEEHKRMEPGEQSQETALGKLTNDDLLGLKKNYERWTSYIRFVFLLMTLISLLSDVMIACTVIYFHTMPQKVAGGAIAISSWFFTYRYWFKKAASPGLPGSGFFKYQDEERKEGILRRRSSINKDPRAQNCMFMGMPLKPQRDSKRKETDTSDQFVGDKETHEHKYGQRPDFFSQELTQRRQL